MQRRTPLTGLAAASLASAAASRVGHSQGRCKLKIRDVEIWKLEGKVEILTGVHRQYHSQPIHLYEQHRPAPYSDTGAGKKEVQPKTALYLKIQTDDDLTGVYGPVDDEAAVVMDRQLKGFLIGEDALAIESLWDRMYRSNRHSRSGHFMMGVSAIDNALWDLRGKFFGVPVYQLLGGPTRDPIECYGSCLLYSVETEPARRMSAEVKERGFRHQKWFLSHGPAHGPEGLRKNVDLVRNLRESVGPEVDLMFDAFMSWDLNYAMRWCKQVEQYDPRWIEEPFHASKIRSFTELRTKTSIPVASGEHFYNRWEAQRFIDADAIDVLQTDPEWCGGVSELVKICAIASANDIHVIPHGHNIHAALHVVASQSPITCPLVEYLINKIEGHYQYYHFDKYPPLAVDGKIALSDRPGFGIEMDEGKVEKQTRMNWAAAVGPNVIPGER